MASKTRVKWKPLGWLGYNSILDSSTVSWDMVSHRAGLPSQSRASATAPTALSKRCRPVMHSIELTIAYLSWLVEESAVFSASFSNTAPVTALFPVASVPWTTTFLHGAAFGCYLLADLAQG